MPHHTPHRLPLHLQPFDPCFEIRNLLVFRLQRHAEDVARLGHAAGAELVRVEEVGDLGDEGRRGVQGVEEGEDGSGEGAWIRICRGDAGGRWCGGG